MDDLWIVIIIAIIAGAIASRSDEFFRATITTEIILICYEMLRR